MAEENKIPEEEIINPSDIILSDDDDMPQPDTNNYHTEEKEKTDTIQLSITAKFVKLFEECMGKLPYNTVLKNDKNEQIKLTALMNFINSKSSGKMTVKEMNTIISFISTSPFEFVKPLMEIIESGERQSELWTLHQ